ncbi:NACHT domain-containing protein [Flavobacterium anhuiense]|uniref:NACHT domain-containing protein n=1 Tax=Flavobacterium anhuiense TaxID=459526 RepID=UPI000E6B6194|nr:NACHT domain-containing protein [Flavobacterium anhuiense]
MQINNEDKVNFSYLFTPVTTIVDPPINTNFQKLPLEKLSWEDFEKLCLAIVQLEYSINDCEMYGIKGQAQEGIDIFARQNNGRYMSYQCKRYQKFNVGDLDKAVTYFKSKKFLKQSDRLYICTSCEWNKTQIQEKFESLHAELKIEGIDLVKWDKIQISRILKDNPQIVYDFFGEAWVKKFNGETALAKLSKSKTLDARKVVQYRNELSDFYSTIFNLQDPGIPIKELNIPHTIQERFIIPDIISIVKADSFGFSAHESTKNTLFQSFYNRDEYYHEEYWYSENEDNERLKKINRILEEEENSIDLRLNIDDALLESDKNIIIGDPGAGKSTLLRYIVLDILSTKPKLECTSLKYGKLLPIWLPFAFITKHLSINDSLNISEILKLWFNGFGKKHLFEIAKCALEDERLFLIIDGIDEWSNISSAQQAITRIETIRGLYDCKVLYSSRPYGFKILKDYFTNLKVLKLAGFSNDQQLAFVENWYSKWISVQKKSKDQNFLKTQAQIFLKELDQTGDLKKLAETPLLLSILIIQKLRDAVLPKNKLEALKEITQYLINKHPAKRVSDAGIVLESKNDIDFKDIFCELAIYIQKESNDGVILKSEAQKIIEDYLYNYAGYTVAKSKLRSKELIDVGANSFGIIIEKSNDEISFSHKQFQEFLAAQYLIESDEEFAVNFINSFASTPTSHQVIVSFFGLIPIKQVMKFKKCYGVLTNAFREIYQENYLKLLSYEVAINIENAPNDIAHDSFNSILEEFENETDYLYKKALLRCILASIYNSKLSEKAQEYLVRYMPNIYKYNDYRVNYMESVEELNSIQLKFLKNVFINGTIDMRYDCSKVFRSHIKDERVIDFLKNIFLKCLNPEVSAFAINSLITDKLDENEVQLLLDSVKVKTTLIDFFKFKFKVFSKRHSDDDLQEVLNLIDNFPFQLEQEVINVLIDGFEANDKLKKILLDATDRENQYSRDLIIDSAIAWKVLFHGYNKDSEIIELIIHEFETKKYPFGGLRNNLFHNLVYYFQGNEAIKTVVEKWLKNKLEEFKIVDNDIAFACVFLANEDAKNVLLDDLLKSGISHWPVMALLDGWPDDREINNALKIYFKTGDRKKTAAAAGFVPRVFFDDKEEGVKILEKILFDRDVFWRERAIVPLIELNRDYFETEILEELLADLETFPKDIFNQYYSAIDCLVKNFSNNKKVESFAFGCLEKDSNIYKILIPYYPEKDKNEENELKKSLPLVKDLRLLIIEKLSELTFLPQIIEHAFYDFNSEEDEEIKGDIAMCLFNHLKSTNPDKIPEFCSPLVFAVGFDHEILRNIAFTGFLTVHKLDIYFKTKEISPNSKSKEIAAPSDLFSNYGYRKVVSGQMVKNIIDNFEYFISYTGKDFKNILKNARTKTSIEDIWSFFARHSVRSSPTFPYIMEFITNNSETIENSSIITFLNRTSPRSAILKQLLIKIIKSPEPKNKPLAGQLLGTNFKGDDQVYNEVKKVEGIDDSGRIIALCKGWPEEKVLKEIFDEIVTNNTQVNYHVGYNLKFLLRDIDNLLIFVKKVIENPTESRRYHQFFFGPMIERISRDQDLCNAIKKALLNSSTINERISYYNLLSQVNLIDDEIRHWKNQFKDYHNDQGYDIITNTEVRLKNILFDNYYYYN